MRFQSGQSRSRAKLLAAGGALALLLAACGSSSSSSSSTTTSGAGGSSTTGGSQVATGTPINIQMPNLQGSTQGVNLPAGSQGAQAAVDWINHHGGVQGHPLKLTVCDLLTTPASDVACANSIAAADPVAVVVAAVDNATPIITALAAANIPYLSMAANAPLELASPDAFALSGSNNASYNMVAQNEKKLGGTKVSLVLISAPGAEASVQATAAPSFALGGQTVKVLLTSPTGQPDMTPTIQAATSGGATSVFLDEDPTTCIAALNAKGTLAVTGVRFYADDSCETKAVVTAAGANAAGTFFVAPNDPSNTNDPDYSTYTSAMDQYAPGVEHVGYAPAGFTTVMDLYRFMKTIPSGTAITSTSVKSAIKTAKAVPAFLGAGTTLTCDGKAVPLEPSVCSGSFFLEKYTGTQFSYVGLSTLPSS